MCTKEVVGEGEVEYVDSMIQWIERGGGVRTGEVVDIGMSVSRI